MQIHHPDDPGGIHSRNCWQLAEDIPLADDTDDDEERAAKAAFFHELEHRHGGPLSYGELQQWEKSLEDSENDTPDNNKAPFGSVTAPLTATSPACSHGWMTPATTKDSKATAATPLDDASTDDIDDECVITEAVSSRYASRRESPSIRSAALASLSFVSDAALPPALELASSPKRSIRSLSAEPAAALSTGVQLVSRVGWSSADAPPQTSSAAVHGGAAEGERDVRLQ